MGSLRAKMKGANTRTTGSDLPKVLNVGRKPLN